MHNFIKKSGLKSEQEFYAKYPTEESFFKDFPMMQYGGLMRRWNKFQGWLSDKNLAGKKHLDHGVNRTQKLITEFNETKQADPITLDDVAIVQDTYRSMGLPVTKNYSKTDKYVGSITSTYRFPENQIPEQQVVPNTPATNRPAEPYPSGVSVTPVYDPNGYNLLGMQGSDGNFYRAANMPEDQWQQVLPILNNTQKMNDLISAKFGRGYHPAFQMTASMKKGGYKEYQSGGLNMGHVDAVSPFTSMTSPQSSQGQMINLQIQNQLLQNLLQEASESRAMDFVNPSNPMMGGMSPSTAFQGKTKIKIKNSPGANFNTGVMTNSMNDNTNSQTGIFQAGGLQELFSQGSPNSEVEGDENITLPNGISFNVDGPTHAGGGIKMNLPKDTFVFSEDLKAPEDIVREFLNIDEDKKLKKSQKNMSFADLAKIYKTDKDFEKRGKEDHYKQITAEINITNKQIKLDELKFLQERFKFGLGKDNDLVNLSQAKVSSYQGGGRHPVEMNELPYYTGILPIDFTRSTPKQTSIFIPQQAVAQTPVKDDFQTLDLNKIDEANRLSLLGSMLSSIGTTNYPVMMPGLPAPSYGRGIDTTAIQQSMMNNTVGQQASMINNSNASETEKLALLNNLMAKIGAQTPNIDSSAQLMDQNRQMMNSFNMQAHQQAVVNLDNYMRQVDNVNKGKTTLRNQTIKNLTNYAQAKAQSDTYLPLALEMSGMIIDRNGNNIRYRPNPVNNIYLDKLLELERLMQTRGNTTSNTTSKTDPKSKTAN